MLADAIVRGRGTGAETTMQETFGGGERGEGEGPVPQAASPRKSRRRSIFGSFVKGMALLVVLGVLAFVGAVAWVAGEVGVLEKADDAPRPAVLFVSDDGKPFAHKGDYRDRPVTRAELPDSLVHAVVSIEDRRFYDHFGFDPLGMLRAARTNYDAGGIVEGGSTLTQQLAKLAYLSDDRTYTRKIKEVLLAVWLEYHLSKDEILARYLDNAYYGNGVNGIRAAARHYFGKDVSELDLSESVVLAGMLRAPSHYSPTVNPEASRKRARQVLRAMREAGYLTADEAANVEPAKPESLRTDIPAGGYFADWMMAKLDDRMVSMNGEVRLHTSLDTNLQAAAERAVRQGLDDAGPKAHATQAALVAMRPDGQVVAMVGGRDYGESRFNRAVQARRQPGSSFKLFAYLAALRYGATPDTRVVDQPIDIDGWEPENYGGNYRGAMSVEQAFALSVNTVAVQLSQTVGPSEVVRAAKDLGIRSPLQPLPSTPLGTQGVSLLEMTSAYAAVARGAYPVHPTGLPYDVDNVGRHALPQRADLDRLLRKVVSSGTGRAAQLPIPAAGKTGTSQDYRDAWFVGYAGNLVVGVWVGNDDESAMNRVTGGSVPARIWKRFMMAALKGEAIDDAPEPLLVDAEGGDGNREDLFDKKYAEASSAGSQSSSSASEAGAQATTHATAYVDSRRRAEPDYPLRTRSRAHARSAAAHRTSPASPRYTGGPTRTYK